MPFTLAHPAAVLPFVRGRFVTAGLVAGAMAPDLPYFARAARIPVYAGAWYEPFLNATTSHSWSGAVTVSLVYALALCGCYRLVRAPLLDLAPVQVPAGRSEACSRSPLVGLGWLVASALLGIATHLVWDALTHADGSVVPGAELLRAPMVGELSWARALRHASSAVGLAVVAGYVARRLRGAPRRRLGARRAWTLAVGAGLVLTAGLVNGWRAAAYAGGRSGDRAAELVLSQAAKGAGAAAIAVLLLYAVAWWTARARAGHRRP